MSTAAEPIRRGHCPRCGPDRFADIVAHHCERFQHDDHPIWSQVDWRILKCRGCERVYAQTDEMFSEDYTVVELPNGETIEDYDHKIAHWPAPNRRTPPEWSLEVELLDNALGSLLDDVFGCLNAALQVPAAVAMRTAFDRAAELLGIDPAVSFEEKLKEMQHRGHIGRGEQETIAVLTDAGGAAAHRGWRPKPQELDTLISILENFLHRTFVLGEAARQLRASVPARQKRKPKASG